MVSRYKVRRDKNVTMLTDTRLRSIDAHCTNANSGVIIPENTCITAPITASMWWRDVDSSKR